MIVDGTAIASKVAGQGPWFVFSALAHFVAYLLIKVFLRQSTAPSAHHSLYSIKIVSSLNAVASVVLGYLLVSDPGARANMVYGHAEWRAFACNWVFGYFLYDTIVMFGVPLLSGTSRLADGKVFSPFNPMFLHHVALTLFWPVTVVSDLGSFFIGIMFMMELSTPLVHLRFFLSSMGSKETFLYKVCGILMIVAFFVCRILVAPYIFWIYGLEIKATSVWEVFSIPTHCRVGTAFLAALQVYWFSQMLNGAFEVFCSSKKKSKNA